MNATSLLCGVAVFALVSSATADVTPDTDVWPNGHAGDVHVVGALAFGTCARHDDLVGGSGVCGEAILGLDIPFRMWQLIARIDLEAGFGWSPATSFTDTNGISYASGGPGVSLRPLMTFDITRIFFLRVGPEWRASATLGRFDSSIHGVLDFGIHVAHTLDVGVRAYGGADGIEKAEANAPYDRGNAFTLAWGSLLLFRAYGP